MPFLALPGGISLFYELLPCLDDPTHDVASSSTSAPSSPLPSNKPTLIILSPLLCDITSRCPQATDPRIRAAFNVVCIDLRSQGRTRNEVRASYDHGVAAAEVAFAMEALRIPPSYVYAPGFVAFPVAVQLAILFPELVLGLAFAGICSVFGTPWALKSFQ